MNTPFKTLSLLTLILNVATQTASFCMDATDYDYIFPAFASPVVDEARVQEAELLRMVLAERERFVTLRRSAIEAALQDQSWAGKKARGEDAYLRTYAEQTRQLAESRSVTLFLKQEAAERVEKTISDRSISGTPYNTSRMQNFIITLWHKASGALREYHALTRADITDNKRYLQPLIDKNNELIEHLHNDTTRSQEQREELAVYIAKQDALIRYLSNNPYTCLLYRRALEQTKNNLTSLWR